MSSHETINKRPPFVKTFLILMAVVLLISGFLWACSVLRIKDFWVAFLFLLYWGMIEHTVPQKLPKCILGALLGLSLCFAISALPKVMGEAGGMVFIGVIMVVVYIQLLGWLTVVINPMAMIFLTVGTIPAVQAEFDFANALIALAFGVVYFAGILAGVPLLLKRKAGRDVNQTV